MSWIYTPDVDALRNGGRALNSNCCIGVDSDDHKRTLFGLCKFPFNILTDHIDIVANIIIVSNSGSVLTSIIIKDTLLTTSINVAPISQIGS